MYETGRLMDAFHASRHSSPQQLLDSLVGGITRFTGGRERADDQTLLLMAYL